MPTPELDRYLDRTGRLRVYPTKAARKQIVLAFLASKFESRREYREAEVNALLREHHTFDDPALLRRELFDWGYLDRTPDGSRYWVVSEAPAVRTHPTEEAVE
jgi:hypothetical protein